MAAPGSPWGHPRAAGEGGGGTRAGDGRRAGVARTSAFGDCWHWGGPARSPQPQRVPGVSPCPGEQLQGGQACGQGRGGQSRAGNGAGEHPVLFLVSISSLFSTCFPYLDLLFLSSPPLLAILILLLLLLSSSPLFFWAASSSSPLGLHILFPHHLLLLTFPSSLLGLIITSWATFSSLLSSLSSPPLR